MRRRSALFALLAVLLHAFAPLLAGAAPGGATQQIELCTAHGIVTVAVDAGGAPAPARGAPDHCHSCAFHCSVAPANGARPALRAATAAPHTLAPQPDCRAQTRTASRPRAPPVAS